MLDAHEQIALSFSNKDIHLPVKNVHVSVVVVCNKTLYTSVQD